MMKKGSTVYPRPSVADTSGNQRILKLEGTLDNHPAWGFPEGAPGKGCL